MRKISMILMCLVIVITCSLFGGCKKDEFVEVCSVSYTMGGKTETSISQLAIKFSDLIEITKEEYNTFDDAYTFDFSKYIFDNISIGRDKTTIEKYKINETIAWRDFYPAGYKYYKNTILSKEIQIVSIKIIDSRSFELKTFDNNVTYYSVENYTVEYFN